MELIQTYNNKAALTGFRSSFQTILLTFVNRHAGIFKALARGGTPYGGNWLSAKAKSAPSQSITSKERIAVVQHLIDELNQTVNQLNDQLNAEAKPTDQQAAKAGEIGLNRFRSLQTEA